MTAYPCNPKRKLNQRHFKRATSLFIPLSCLGVIDGESFRINGNTETGNLRQPKRWVNCTPSHGSPGHGWLAWDQTWVCSDASSMAMQCLRPMRHSGGPKSRLFNYKPRGCVFLVSLYFSLIGQSWSQENTH